MFVLGDFAGEPDGGEGDDRGEEQHHQAQAIDAEGEVDPPLAADRAGGDELKTALAGFEARDKRAAVAARVKPGGPERGAPGRRAEQNRERGQQSGRKTMKSRITGKV